MRNTRIWLSAVCIGLFSIASFSAGCGSDDPGAGENQSEVDAGVGDAGVDDVGPDDAGPDDDVDDVGPTEDADDAGTDTDAETDVEIPDDAPEAMDDYLVCEFDLDCPINGSSCITELSFNRADADGVDSVDVAEIFDGVDSGQGVCAEDCASDPTICDTVFWSDPGGQAHESSCQLVATGAEPYQVDPDDPAQIEVDYDEMLDGQAFAAICLPPFDRAQGRSGSFCASCSAQDDCGDEASCYNALTEELVDEPGESGQSYCVEPCDGHDDCPMGFDCWELGEEGDSDEAFCIPIEDTCTDCVDRDEDGYGTGHCGSSDERQTPFDCDDRNPDAYFEADDDGQPTAHPFPAFCYDDPEDERYYNDLNCSGVLDHLEQVGVEQFPEEHCASCGDQCAGLVDPDDADAGVYTCMSDGDGQPFCGAGCGTTQGELQDYDPDNPEQLGRATCGDVPTECDIDLTEEYLKGAPQQSGVPDYRDPDTAEVSDYIWYEATEDGWATSDATPHFFCSAQEAEEALENPTQRRSCHPTEAGAQPGAEQLCDNIDWNCSGDTGPEDNDTVGDIDGDTFTVGQDCDVPGAYGECKPGVALCADGADGPEMLCESMATDYPVSTPACPVDDGSEDYDIDTTCDGTPDYLSDTFDSTGVSIELVDEHGDVIDDNPDTVTVGDACKVPGALGECRIGEVRCDGQGGLHCSQTIQPEAEAPGFDGVDRSCDGSVRYASNGGEPHVIFFDTADAGPEDLTEAIEEALNCGTTDTGFDVPCDIFMESSNNLSADATVVLEEGLHIYGGFNDDTWDPTADNFSEPSLTSGSTVTVDDSVGLRAIDIQEETHLHGVEIVTEDIEVVGCEPNIGAICQSCEGVDFQHVQITAGEGSPGAAGGNGGDGSDASDPAILGGDNDGAEAGCSSESVDDYSGGLGHPHDGGDAPGTVGQDGEDGEPDSTHGGIGNGINNTHHGGHGIGTSPSSPSGWHSFEWSGVGPSGVELVGCPTASTVELDEYSHGGGGGAVTTTALATGQHCASGGGGGGGGGEPGENGAAGAPSVGMMLIDTDHDDLGGLTIQGGQGGVGGDGGDGGDGGEGGRGGYQPHSSTVLRGGDGGNGAGGPGGTGGNGGVSIGLLRINSTLGTESVSPNVSATGGGQGGMFGSGGDGAGDADDGDNGNSGVSGQSCAHFRSDSDYELSLDLSIEYDSSGTPGCTD